MVRGTSGQIKEEDYTRIDYNYPCQKAKDVQFSWMEGCEDCLQKVSHLNF